jgi:hypothetical protein
MVCLEGKCYSQVMRVCSAIDSQLSHCYVQRPPRSRLTSAEKHAEPRDKLICSRPYIYTHHRTVA